MLINIINILIFILININLLMTYFLTVNPLALKCTVCLTAADVSQYYIELETKNQHMLICSKSE